MSIHQLIYLSKASRPFDSVDFLKLLTSARKNNINLRVTGSLFYNGDWFLQVLEGDLPTIQDLFRKIENDNRHMQAKVLYLKPGKNRKFLAGL